MPDGDRETSDDEWVITDRKPQKQPTEPESPFIIWSVALAAVAIYAVLGIRRSSM